MDLLSLPIPFGRGNPPYRPFVCCDRLAPPFCCPPSLLARFCALFPPSERSIVKFKNSYCLSLSLAPSLPLSLYPSLLLSSTLSLALSLSHTHRDKAVASLQKTWLFSAKPSSSEKIDSASPLSLSFLIYIYIYIYTF